MNVLSIAQLRQLAAGLTMEHALDQHSDEHRLAAVLILVYPGQDEPHVVLTRRTSHLSNHAGQISFPGGSVDADDLDPVHTALREAREEIALDDRTVDVLGILDITVLPSGFAVAPVLAVMDAQPVLQANPHEVEEIFSIPLSMISDLSRYGRDSLERDGQRREFFYLYYGDYYIWGATARILRALAELLQDGSEI
jgi:8-oxo-dGTP pyrophosphatase MutT (NUDIX family)